MTIDTSSPRERMGEPTIVYQLRAIDAGLEDSIAVAGADERGGVGVLRCRWDTQVVRLDEAGTA
jgi:hypothetical protein